MLFHQGGCVGLGRMRQVNNCGLGLAKNELWNPQLLSPWMGITLNFSEMTEKCCEVRGRSEHGWRSRQAICCWFNASMCTGGGLGLTGTYPRHAEYPSLLKANSQVAQRSPYVFCCGVTSPSPVASALAGLCICPGFGFFSLSESEICLQGNEAVVRIYACMHSPTHICKHDSSVSQAEPS